MIASAAFLFDTPASAFLAGLGTGLLVGGILAARATVEALRGRHDARP